MPESATPHRALGWYRDPADPARLRYWGERGWTNHRRPRPSWDFDSEAWSPPDPDTDPDTPGEGPVLEGPVRPAELPAIATAVSSAHDLLASASPAVAPRRRGRMGHSSASWHPDTASRPIGWSNSRRPVLVFCLLSVLALVAMVTTVDLARPSSQPAWQLSDQAFVSQANAACAAGLPPLRITPSSGSATANDAKGITALADRLGHLPLAARDQPEVYAWLTDWRTYAHDAQAASGPGDPRVAQGHQAAVRADDFAVANELIECTLSAAPDTSGAQPY